MFIAKSTKLPMTDPAGAGILMLTLIGGFC